MQSVHEWRDLNPRKHGGYSSMNEGKMKENVVAIFNVKFRVCKIFVAGNALEILFFFVVLLSLRKEYYVRM